MEGMEMSDKSFWINKKVLVTGCTGFKGSWLVTWLHSLGAEILGYALSPPTDPSLFFLAEIQNRINWVLGDIRDVVRLEETMVKFQPEIVFHLAAQPLVRESYINPIETYEVNVMGTVNVLEAVRKSKSVKVVVNITTDKCYENHEWDWGYRENEPMGGHDPYSSSKGCAELITSAYRRSFFSNNGHSAQVATARAGNVIGGGDYAKERLIPDIIRSITTSNFVKIRNPNSVRPWQHVLEPLSGYIRLAELLYEDDKTYAEAWNFGPNDEDARTVEWIVQKMCEYFPGNKGYIVEKSEGPHEAKLLKLDISKARNRLDWKPRWKLSTTLQKIVQFETSNVHAWQKMMEQISEYSGIRNED